MNINQDIIAYWKNRGYHIDDIQKVCFQCDQHLCGRIDFITDRTIHVNFSNTVYNQKQGHPGALVSFLDDVVAAWNGPPLRGSIIVWLEDGMWLSDLSTIAPIFAFGKTRTDAHTMLIPDPAFMGAKGYGSDLEIIDHADNGIPWEKKLRTFFWRGAGSGLMQYTNQSWRLAPRLHLALLSKAKNDSTLLDAYLSKTVNYPHLDIEAQIKAEEIVRESVPFGAFHQFRYLFDVDGESCAWKSFFYKMYSKSLVLKVESENMQWYYDRISPGKHFISVKKDLSDLDQVMDWVLTHDTESKAIAERGSEVLHAITYQAAIKETGKLFHEILSTQKGIN